MKVLRLLFGLMLGAIMVLLVNLRFSYNRRLWKSNLTEASPFIPPASIELDREIELPVQGIPYKRMTREAFLGKIPFKYIAMGILKKMNKNDNPSNSEIVEEKQVQLTTDKPSEPQEKKQTNPNSRSSQLNAITLIRL